MQALGGARRARNSIPKVNQNPRISQARGVKHRPYQSGLARAAATKPLTMATTPAQASNTVPATQSEPTDPLKTTAGSPAASAPNPFAPPSYTPQAGQEDPRDATYWANLAKLRFTDEQEYAKGLAEQTHADTDYADAVQTAIRNRTAEQRGLGENAIRSNLGNSGWLDRNESEQTTAYTQARAHAQLTKGEEDQARAAARAALIQGYGIDAAGLLAESTTRYGERKEHEAENAPGEGASGESGGATGGGGKSASKKKGGGNKGGAKGTGGTPYVPPKKNAPKEALANRQPAKKGKH